jgi:CheY-like chemotaxis protein
MPSSAAAIASPDAECRCICYAARVSHRWLLLWKPAYTCNWAYCLRSLQNSFPSAFPVLMLFGFHAFVIVYWLVLGLQSGLSYYGKYQERAQHALRLELRASELKGQMVNAQLSALKMQLQPHFLFNTLNAIVVLVRQQKGQEAEETLGRFSDLLRCVLSDIDAQEVPLSRELEYLRLYLAIEQVRFSDRLRVALHVDSTVLEATVPHMSLQLIVENALRHGIGRSATGGAIEIRAVRVNDTLEICVEDDGPGVSGTPLSDGSGMGLSNTTSQATLRRHCKTGHHFHRRRRHCRDDGAAVSHLRVRRPMNGRRESLTVLIVDDEPLARDGLRMLLGADPGVSTILEARNGEESVSSILSRRPDLVFLDVQMPEMDGFSVVQKVGAERMSAVVFVTAHDQYAIQAFEVNAIDYLLKTVTAPRFAQALERARARMSFSDELAAG